MLAWDSKKLLRFYDVKSHKYLQAATLWKISRSKGDTKNSAYFERYKYDANMESAIVSAYHE